MTKQYRMVVGSDDAGLEYKTAIMSDLKGDPRVASVIDLGVSADAPRTLAYAEVAIRAGELIRDGAVDRAILFCGTGIGVAIAANKVDGIRATVAHDSFSVERSIRSNNCQVLTIGQRVIGLQLARRLALEWLGYDFDAGSLSGGKIQIITDYESSQAHRP